MESKGSLGWDHVAKSSEYDLANKILCTDTADKLNSLKEELHNENRSPVKHATIYLLIAALCKQQFNEIFKDQKAKHSLKHLFKALKQFQLLDQEEPKS